MITTGQQIIRQWYKQKNWQQFPFQQEMEEAYLGGNSGLLNAPTGSGADVADLQVFERLGAALRLVGIQRRDEQDRSEETGGGGAHGGAVSRMVGPYPE